MEGFGKAASRLKGVCLEAKAIRVAHVKALHPAERVLSREEQALENPFLEESCTGLHTQRTCPLQSLVLDIPCGDKECLEDRHKLYALGKDAYFANLTFKEVHEQRGLR